MSLLNLKFVSCAIYKKMKDEDGDNFILVLPSPLFLPRKCKSDTGRQNCRYLKGRTAMRTADEARGPADKVLDEERLDLALGHGRT